MKAYEIRFTGCRYGAISQHHQIDATRFANSPDEAIQLLYKPLPIAFEHISQPDVREIPSPFCAQGLFNLSQNDRATHESFAHWVNMMVSEMSRVARRSAKANADWHDDPDGADHGLYHAPVDQQYPSEMQLEAVAEVVLYFLRERPAGLNICGRLTLTAEVQS